MTDETGVCIFFLLPASNECFLLEDGRKVMRSWEGYK